MKKIDKFVALVLAADRTANDPVAIKSGMACKAFTPICGIPMIIRVLDALEASGMIRSIILCGPPESTLPGCTELEQRIGRGDITWVPNLDSPSRSANRGLEHIDEGVPVLLTTADHALLTPEIVQYFLRESSKADSDATVGLVKHENVMAKFPGTKRTVIRLRDGNFCGCNLYTFLNHHGRDLVSFWRRAEDLRKHPWRLVGEILGPMAILLYLLRISTLNQALNAVSAKAGVRSRAVIIPYAQAGVDVDKAEDIVLVESILEEAMPLSFNKNGTS
ncbi:MAG: nucleotidyltransferase family protein [Nitrosomonadaceae bacterium]|nr:nucleotidyltransferase family protein [Nitrosomonadaceae bacterium]